MTGLLRIYTLGGLQVFKGDEPVTALETRKVEALLVYLACTRRVHSRETLAELLWEERSQQQSQANLRVALANLKKHLGEFLEISREGVGIALGANIWLDVVELEGNLSALRTGEGVKTAQTAECIERAAALYRGEFLEGFFVRECQGFEDWHMRERERLHRLTVEALHDLVDFEIERRAYKTGVAHAMRLLELDPLMETAHRQMMSLLASSGRRGEALAQYQACRKILHEELGIEPAAATKALYEKIRQGELVGTAAEARVIKGYEIKEQIGVGNFGAVYRAHQPGVGRDVAVKVILPQFANEPEFIRRFQAEAQIVARLEHPHIVPLYDYWREAEGAYLVMRWLRGGSLEDELRRGLPGMERAVEIVEQVASALSAAHRQGILHRDLKPANILLDVEGNSYLSDFGIAKVLEADGGKTHSGAWVGSPVYMSPEQIRAETLGPQSDIYSLGVMVYEMLTGELPFAVDSLGALIDKQLHEALPLVHAKRAELPPQVDEVLQRATAKNPVERYPDALSFAAALRQALSGVIPSATGEVLAAIQPKLVNPYKGLRAFQEADAGDFFGREALTRQLIARLGEDGEGARFLAVVGPSGCGKSSVVHAGLVPALRKGALPGSEKWFILEMLPGTHPFEELEIGLLRMAARPELNLSEQLRRDERGLIRAARLTLPEDGSQLLLIVDQFEELFTLVSDKSEAKCFLDSLYAAITEPHSPLWIIVTLRADFYDRPLTHAEFSHLVQARTEVVVPLTVEELQCAIRAPAERVGVSLETGLEAAIVAEAIDQAGALPLLQYALTELFERRENGRLTRQAYELLGGIQGALGRRAEEVFASLNGASQIAARQLFLRLVTLGEGTEDTRRRVLRSELETLAEIDAQVPNSAQLSTIEAAIQAFGHARLLSFDRDPSTRSPTVEVAHEALLREWPRLRQWLDSSRADVRQERLLGNAAAEWLNAAGDPSFLLRGARLSQFEGWAGSTQIALTHNERDFLEASLAERQSQEQAEAERQRQELETARKLAETERQRAEEQTQSTRRLRRRAWLLAGGLVLAAVLGVIALFASQQASRSAQTAQAEANTRATAEAVALSEANTRATAQVDAENQRSEAESQRLEAEAQRNEARRQASIGLAAQALREIDTGRQDIGVLLALEALENYPYTWQAEQALGQTVLKSRLRLVLSHDNAVSSVMWSLDGKRLLTASADTTARVWDAASGEQLLRLDHENQIYSAHWSPDESKILTHLVDPDTLIMWDASSGERLFDIEGHSEWITIVGWSPAGDRIAAGGEGGTAWIWDAQNGNELHALSGHQAYINVIDWSPSGEQVLTMSDDQTAMVWDTQTGQPIHTLRGHTDWVFDGGWSPSGDRILTASRDGTLKVWDAATGKERLMITASPPNSPMIAKWSPSGERILAGPVAGAGPKVYDAATGEEQIALYPGNPSVYLRVIDWSPVGDRILTALADGSASIWDASSGVELFTLRGHTGQIDILSETPLWSPDGQRVATCSTDGTAMVWDLTPVPTLAGHQSRAWAFWSPAGDRVLSPSRDGTTRIWDPSSTTQLLSVDAKDYLGYIPFSSWSPSGDRFSLGSDSGKTTIYDAATGSELLTISVPGLDGPTIPTWSPDGSLIAIGFASDGSIRLWDADSGEETQFLYSYTSGGDWSLASGNYINLLEWSPSGDKIFSTAYRTYEPLRVWDVTTGEILSPTLTNDSIVAAWSPDGKRIATYGYNQPGNIWDAQTSEKLLEFSGHTGQVTGLTWSPTGERLASSSYDGMVLVRDTHSGLEVLRYPIGTAVNSVDWSPDGRQLLISYAGRIVMLPVWNTAQELIDYAKACCVVRELSPEDRVLYGLPPEE